MGTEQITRPVFHYTCDWPLCKKEEFTDQAVVTYRRWTFCSLLRGCHGSNDIPITTGGHGGSCSCFFEVVMGPTTWTRLVPRPPKRYSYNNGGPRRVLLLCEDHFYAFYAWFDRPEPEPEPETRKK